MSAAEIIEQIKALPREEQLQVKDYVEKAMAERSAIRFATDDEAAAAGDAVVAEYPATFRRLAE